MAYEFQVNYSLTIGNVMYEQDFENKNIIFPLNFGEGVDPATAPAIQFKSDNDGVKADFEGSFKQRFGKAFDDFHIGVAWKLINSVPDFYEKLPLMPNVEVYWNAIKNLKPEILTGCNPQNYALHEAGKHKWHANNHYFADGSVFLRDTKMIVCVTKNKPLHIVNPGDILCDDHIKNGKKWVAAGGIYVRYKNAHQAAEDCLDLFATLREMGYRLNGDA